MALNILFLSHEDIKRVLTMEETIELMKTAFLQISNGSVSTPVRTSIEIPEHDAGALFMPVHSDESQLIGLKMVSVFKNNPGLNLPLIHAIVLLMDGKTGEPLALMDGEYITALRTGAGSGLASDLLSRGDSTTLGIIGAGVQGRTQTLAVCSVREISRIKIWDKNEASATNLADYIKKELKIDVATNPSEEAISECDIICTATSSPIPVLSDKLLKEGVHINAIGAYQPDKREIPSETIERCKLIVDQRQACLKEAGDIILPIQEKRIDESHIYAELGEIVANDLPGRENDSEITVFKSVGNAAQDLITTAHVYKKAAQTECGIQISL
jgi:ornithine cyclodeaminase/alanine dehydrogenase-like protein (mu-crystallin family)